MEKLLCIKENWIDGGVTIGKTYHSIKRDMKRSDPLVFLIDADVDEEEEIRSEWWVPLECFLSWHDVPLIGV